MSVRKPFCVKKRTVETAVAHLPEAFPLTHALVEFDLLICASGFEDRVLSIPEWLVANNVAIGKGVMVGRYRTNPIENSNREKKLLPLLESISSEIVYFDADSPNEILKEINQKCKGFLADEVVNVALDISGGSSCFILSVMAALFSLPVDVKLTIYYTTAQNYHEPCLIDHDEPLELWTPQDMRESGVQEVDANELYPGVHHDHLPSFVIAIPSMYPARMQRALSFLGVEPFSGADERVYWILPNTDDQSHIWRQRQVKKSLISLIHGPVESGGGARDLPDGRWGYCDVLDYKGCARLVMDQIEKNSGTNISIIHAGTKLQAVGIALALAGRCEVAVIKSRPSSFSADQYSFGVGVRYGIKIESLRGIKEAFLSVGSLDFTTEYLQG